MRNILPLLLVLVTFVGRAQTASVLTGVVLDARTQSAVPFATLAVPGQPGGTVTNQEGAFRLALPSVGADSVRVQALGYSALTVSAKAAPATLVLKLQPQPFALQEVTVTALLPTTLLKRAVHQTTARMVSPVELQTYYREFTTYNGQIAKFADALVDYYLKGNPRRPRSPEVQVRVRESRAGEAPMAPNDAKKALPSPLSVARTGSFYDVTQGSPYLDSTAFAKYLYTVLETPAGATKIPYYEVHCTPITREPEHLRQATVRIDRQTMAILLIESDLPANLQPYMKTVNLLVIKAQVTQVRSRVEYREVKGRLYPSFVRQQISMDVTQLSGPTMQYDFTSEMLVRSLGETPAPFPKAEQYSGSLFKRGNKYSRPYWREGNVVPATAAEEAAIRELDKNGER